MKAYFLFTASGPLVILTSHNSISDPRLLGKFRSKGLTKFVAYEVPIESAKAKYGKHLDIVLQDLHQTDDLRILDWSGERAFRNFSLKELGNPFYYEAEYHDEME